MPVRGKWAVMCAVALALSAGPTVSYASAAVIDRPPVPYTSVVEDVPDTALVIDGVSGLTSSVRSGETRFERLWELFEPTYKGTARVPAEWEEGRYPAARLTVLWAVREVGGRPQNSLAPGAAVAGLDQLVVAEDGTPWVRRDVSPVVEDDDIRWHQVDRGVYELWGARAAKAEEPDEGAVTRWLLPGGVGVALGAGGVLLLMRRAATRRDAGPPRDEPRQELIEL